MKQADLELLRELMRMRPVSGDVAAVNRVVDRMKKHLDGHGLHLAVEKLDGGRKVLYASTRKGKRPALLLNAHLDVVPAIREEQYELAEEGGWLVGRGTGDCLGNAVTAARFLIDHAKEFDAGAVFSTDEEIGGASTERMVELGYGARRAILVVDASYGRICVAQKGILVLKLTARGKGGHSSIPYSLDNPIEKLIVGYRRLLRRWRNPADYRDWRDSMAACRFEAGFADNQVPDTAEMTVNFRYVKDSHREKILERVRRITGCEVEIGHECPPVEIAADSPEIVALREVMAKRLPGGKVDFERMCGATDARFFKACGVPLAMIGSNSRSVHAQDEAVEAASLDILAGILDDFGAAVAAE